MLDSMRQWNSSFNENNQETKQFEWVHDTIVIVVKRLLHLTRMKYYVIARYFHLLDNYHLARIHENVTLSAAKKQ